MSKSIERLTVEEFKVKLNPGPNNCGINIFIIGNMKNCMREVLNPASLNIDPHGKLFKQLPKKLERTIRWTKVPLQLKPHIKKADIESINETESKFLLEVHIGTSEYKDSFTHEDFMTQINELAKKDDVIELSFNNATAELFSVYTKPSLILNSIGHDQSALWTGHIPEDIRSEADILRIMRWLLFPVLFMTLVWILCFSRDSVFSRVPALFSESTYGHARSQKQIELSDALSKFIKLDDTLVELQRQNQTEKMKPILESIGKIFDVKNITLDAVHIIRNKLEQNFKNEYTPEVRGNAYFNELSAAICYYAPSNRYLFKFYLFCVFFILAQILNRIFDPLEINGYILVSMIVIEGFRFSSGLGFYITLVGVTMGSFIGPLYSCYLHSPFKLFKASAFNSFILILTILPLANYYESTLLGWFIVFSCIDMSRTMLILICNYIGFSQFYLAVRVCINSFLLHAMFIVFKILRITIITSFQPLFIVIGCILLSIGLLIVTTDYYGEIETNKRGTITHSQKHLVMVIHLLSCHSVGYGLGIPGLVYTGYVFIILYVLLLCIELHLRKDSDLVLNVLALVIVCLSAFLLYSSLFFC
jgi:hypothetical protein